MYLYVHIPFCKSKCAYCDFFSIPVGHKPSCGIEKTQGEWKSNVIRESNLSLDSSLIPDSYIDALLIEATFRKKKHSIGQWHSIYIGGGTPSLLSPIQLNRLLMGLTSLCPCIQDAEITLEVNCADIVNLAPQNNTIKNSYLEEATKAGVNRISCGIQSIDDNSLKAVGRRSSAQEAKNALLVLQNWRDNGYTQNIDDNNLPRQFSVDIIAGLPKLSKKKFLLGLEEVLSYKPNHISLYSLMIEDDTPLCKAINDGILTFDADKADSQWLAGCDMLKNKGYCQYEVSNFAKGYSCESKHNSAYWRMDDYIGLGASACGTLGAERFTGIADIDAYCKYWNGVDKTFDFDPPQHISYAEHITTDERSTEFLMMGFRTLRGVDSDEFFRRFKLPIEQKIGTVFTRWQERKLACRNGNFYALTADGLLFLNRFLQEIL